MSTNNWIFGLICGLLLTATQSAAQSFTYVSIDVPCSAFPSGAACPASGYAVATIANGINPGGDIVGQYTDGNNKSHGFLLSDGQFNTIDVDFPCPVDQALHLFACQLFPVGLLEEHIKKDGP